MRASFLFTDVEGSTRFWEADRDGMAASLEVHDRIMRAAIESHRGHVFSTAGDAFAAAFPTADDAAHAALDIQLALLDTEWPGPHIKVRMGIHTGDAQERDGDYFGPTLNRTARVMSAGHGGQILLSSVTSEECRQIARTEVHDLGIHHLKDLEEPEHVFELRHLELPIIERPIKSLDIRRHNLPDYLTSFIGRRPQLAGLDKAVSRHRLVELTGVGGTGKTRLAVEAVRRRIDDFPDGAWLVELAPVTNPQLVMTEIGAVWGLRPGEGATIEEVVTRYLWGRTLLIVVDNCEHVLDSAAAAIKLLLDACPNIRIVATSRESLGIAGEEIIRVPSLGLGEDDGHASEAVQLFLDRAAAVSDGFDPLAEDLEAIRRVCTRIDGIPLGIELAAARLRSMSAQELAQRIEDSFRILSRSAKTALPRQRTLQATIDWSHDLLTAPEQALFRRLAMFLGGFDLAAAEAVAAGEDVEDWEVIDLLDSLVDKSLVIPSVDADQSRYRLLEPIRQYAQERLVESGESETIAGAHASHYAALTAEAMPNLYGPHLPEWMHRISEDYDNVRGALDSLLAGGDLDDYLAICWGVYRFWQHDGRHLEGIEVLVAGLESDLDADPLTRIKAWLEAADLATDITLPVAVEYAQRAVELAEELGDPHVLARAKLYLGAAMITANAGQYSEGSELVVEAEALIVAHPDPSWLPDPAWDQALLDMGLGWYLPHDHPDKVRRYKAGIDGFTQIGDPAMIDRAHGLAVALFGLEDDDWVMDQLSQAIESGNPIGSRSMRPHALMHWALMAVRRDMAERAAAAADEAAGLLGDIGDTNCLIQSLATSANARVLLGRLDEAERRLRSAAHTAVIHDDHRLAGYLTAIAVELTTARGNHEQAATYVGRADTHDYSPHWTERLDQCRTTVEAALGDRFAAPYEAGASMSDGDVLATLADS